MQCQEQNRNAFEELYGRYSGLLMGICLRYAKDEFEAADILQDSFIKIFKYIKDFQFEGSFEGWMRRIAVTTAINQYNKNKKDRLNFPDSDESFVTEKIENEAISNISTEELLRIIQTLPEGYKMVFNLYVIEGYKHAEIAEILNISEGTSKSQLARAKSMLKKKLETFQIAT